MSLLFHSGLRQVLALLCATMLLAGGSLRAASSGENRAYSAVVKSFQDGMWEYCEAACAQFIEKHPKSASGPEVISLQAQAQFKQGKYASTIALLTARQGSAGVLADEYLYWIGEAQFESTNYAAAAAAFGQLTRDFPASAKRLRASVSEAAAFAKLDEWTRVVALLQTPGGAFQSAANATPDDEAVVRGRLLLAEAGLAQKRFADAEAALQPLAPQKLKPELDWQRKFLLCQAQLGANKTNDALQGVGDLLTLAAATGRRDFIAESVAVKGGILEQLGRRDEAIAAYTNNRAANAPVKQQRQALLKITELTLAQGRLTGAVEELEKFLNQFSNAPAADMAWLQLGELHLKQHVIPAQSNAAPPVTNHLQLAMGCFDQLTSTFPNSALLGKADLDRGWCYWLDGNISNSLAAFQVATTRLPPSEDLAVARFKLADAQFAQNDFALALQSYQGALEVAANLPSVKQALTPQARYQMLRCSLALTNLAGATNAMWNILQAYPNSSVADRSVLLVGQGFADLNEPDQARAEFARFVEMFPESPLRPEVELAVAQTYEQKAEWPAAITNYDAWLERFATNWLRPRAEFQRALANFQARNDTNALNQFTNFVVQFATNALAPQAQWWVADHCYNQGDFPNAEKNYKLLFQNWPKSELASEACLMAGRSAVGWQNYAGAIEYFTNLTSRADCPARLKVQATFAAGGALMLLDSGATNRSANLEWAIQLFGTINPTNELAPQAMGEIGKCYFQLGAQDAGRLVQASNAFQQVVELPNAGVAARSQATVGLAMTLESQAKQLAGAEQNALLKLALKHYLKVFYYEEILRDREQPDWFWVKKAGLEAARLAEEMQEWTQAANIYRSLEKLLPPLKESLKRKLQKAEEHLPSGKN